MKIDFTKRPLNHPTFTVAKLNREVKNLLENRYDGLWVEAEVSDVTRAHSGHIYFALSDKGGKAGIGAVMWQGIAARYGGRIRLGTLLRCHGRVTLYEPRGSYQLVVDRVEEAGAGRKAQLLAELKIKLEKEGLLDPSRKRPLPTYPKRIGVVTSRDGAAIRDIVKVVKRRFPVEIRLAHAAVQGDEAPAQIAEGISRFANREVDVVIVGRGGGSSDDLDGFNDERVVRAAVDCPVPVVSAVGHEVDMTLLDLVADKRAATPSEAAEMVVPDGEQVREVLSDTERRIQMVLKATVASKRFTLGDVEARLRARDPRVGSLRGAEALASAKIKLAKWPEIALSRARADLANGERPLVDWPERVIRDTRMKIEATTESLKSTAVPLLGAARESLIELTARLNGLSPLSNLERGYAVVRNPGTLMLVRRVADAPPGSEVDITLRDGHLLCDVKANRNSD